MKISKKLYVRLLGVISFSLMVLILAESLLFIDTSTASASSCGTVYLYTANCQDFCFYNPDNNTTTCYENNYEQWTAPPRQRRKWTKPGQTCQGYINNNCSTFCT